MFFIFNAERVRAPNVTVHRLLQSSTMYFIFYHGKLILLKLGTYYITAKINVQ